MKTRTTLTRLAAALLAALLLAALALPVTVGAEGVDAEPNPDNLQVIIHNNTGLPSMTEKQFDVYQLFKGTPYQENTDNQTNVDGSNGSEWNAGNWDNYTLADIEWGDSVKNPNAFLFFLKFLKNDWNLDPETGNSYFYNCTTAAEVAEVLEGKSNYFLQHFINVILDAGWLEPVLLNPPEPDETEAYAKATVYHGATAKDDYITYQLNQPGYYLFAEKPSEHEGGYDAVSEFILSVLGDQEIDLKASVPVVDKNIVGGDTSEGDTQATEQWFKFQLTGTLPKDFGDFDEFYYEFQDTLSKGLTYCGEVEVTVTVDGVDYTISDDNYTVNPNPATPDNLPDPDAGTSLTITFSDLIKGLTYTAKSNGEAVPEAPDNTIYLNAESKITVTYSAKLNENAVVGSVGNPNDVQLEYSNDPNSNSRGKTNTVEVLTYTFGLDLTKKGVSGGDQVPLEGAGFTLFKGDEPNADWVAKFKDVGDKKEFAGWEDPATAYNDLVQKYQEAKNAYETAHTNEERTAAQGALDAAVDDLQAYLLVSGAEGKLPNVYGLDEGSYYLHEVITPGGYNTMDDLTFKIDATINDATGALEKLEYYQPANALTPSKTYTSADEDLTVWNAGLIPQELLNKKAPFLPFTGGRGRVVFYVLGGLLIAGTATALILTHRKKEEN